MYIYIYIYIYIHIYTHTHTYIYIYLVYTVLMHFALRWCNFITTTGVLRYNRVCFFPVHLHLNLYSSFS